MKTSITIYIPEYTKFLMYFDNDVVQVDLDGSYLTAPETALRHATDVAEQAGLTPNFLAPKLFTASTLPDIPTNFDFMCCPRSISDLSSKIGLGYIGPRVRRIVKSARFPVLITSPCYKEWKSVAVMFGGSSNTLNALKMGLRIRRVSGVELNVFTQSENGNQEELEKIIVEERLEEEMDKYIKQWKIFDGGVFEENLYDIPHDALVVVGASEHSLLRDLMFGSTMEKIHSTISNNMLIVGPNYAAAL